MKAAAGKTMPSPAPAPEPIAGYVLEAQVGHLLRRAQQRHAAIFQEGIGEAQLTPTQFAALVKIKEHGQVSQNHLGRLTAMDPATILGVIQRLAVRDLIERHLDPDDRRHTLLRLTRGGHALVDSLIARARAISAATLAPLSPSEQGAVLALLKKLI